MPEVLEPTQTQTFPRSQTEINYFSETEEIIYPEQREDDMGETSFHYRVISDLMQMLRMFFREREDVFMTGNMNIYYVEGNPYKWFAPDILVAFGVQNHERSVYKIWQEKVFPQVVFEVASDRTWKNDVSGKLKLYEQLGAEEYYILDSEFKYLPSPLMAFRRENDALLPVEISGDKVFSPRLNLEIVRTENNFRLFNPQTGEFLLTLEESEAEKKNFESRAITAEMELELLKAEIEKLKKQNN
ncbi:MAG: Uma2 family endonuclease [Acidobacteriota bacterium]|nr:Uma2 family endonuclease [Acidobacteriota bacterium]